MKLIRGNMHSIEMDLKKVCYMIESDPVQEDVFRCCLMVSTLTANGMCDLLMTEANRLSISGASRDKHQNRYISDVLEITPRNIYKCAGTDELGADVQNRGRTMVLMEALSMGTRWPKVVDRLNVETINRSKLRT